MALTEPRLARTGGRGTHEVANQPPPLEGYDAFAENRPLVEALEREGGAWASGRAHALGRIVGSEEAIDWACEANTHLPRLQSHDRYGNRRDEVSFHPSWHALLRTGIEHGLHALPWRESDSGAQPARAALFMLLTQLEPGVGCPISMTFSAVPALRAQPELAAAWEPKLTASSYEPGLRPIGDKPGVLCGMALTEKQGGSDVRSNRTLAEPLEERGPGRPYALTGHKWFCSAPMSDAFLILAQTAGGLSCFLVPRVLDDGSRNALQLQRLKDKLGNRANASAEMELAGAPGWMVGEEGRGVPTIIEMVNHTRLDCVLATAAGMRQAVEEATWHAAHRSTFGKLLSDQPLMQNVLADLCIESEAATATAMRLARAYDEDADEHERLVRRLGTAVAKYWICKRGPDHAAEALECLGGNGYIEESPMPRRYREQPLMSIWEGSGNVICLDVLRAMARTPQAADALIDELERSRGADPRLDRHLDRLEKSLRDPERLEHRARHIVEQLALGLQAALLVQHAPPAVSDAFCASRLGDAGGRAYGTLPAGLDVRAIIDRHVPHALTR